MCIRDRLDSGRKSPLAIRNGLVLCPREQSGQRPEMRGFMPGIVVVGAQWGDEGKGKATDQIEMCIRDRG